MSEPGFEHWRSMLLDPGWSSAGTVGTWLGWETAVGRSGKQQGVQANGGVVVHDVVGWGDRRQIREPNTRVPNTCD